MRSASAHRAGDGDLAGGRAARVGLAQGQARDAFVGFELSAGTKRSGTSRRSANRDSAVRQIVNTARLVRHNDPHRPRLMRARAYLLCSWSKNSQTMASRGEHLAADILH